MTPAEWTAHALARNDRYLKEFVEALEMCPFARTCRESGALERRVLLQTEADVDATAAVVAGLEQSVFEHVEVALLIFPRLSVTPAAYEQFAAAVRVKASRFFVVAFHPNAPEDTATPERFVQFLRRSPDPTLQLVRMSVLDRVKGSTGDTRYINPAGLDLRAPLPEPPVGVSERITRANFETMRRLGLERMRDLLTATKS